MDPNDREGLPLDGSRRSCPDRLNGRMPRLPQLPWFVLLLGCVREGPAAPSWSATVQARIAADQSAIHAREDRFFADLPAADQRVEFSASGASLGGITLRTTGWGSSDSVRTLASVAPRFGACTEALNPAGDCIRRLEYRHVGLTEWWVGLGEGVEQGWTVGEAEGDEVVVTVQVGGAEIRKDSAGTFLTDGRGREWRVGSVRAWDADGDALVATLTASADTLEIQVNTAGATFPVTIDPVYTTAAWSVSGDAGTAPLAEELANAGDVNGDGFDDLLVARYADDRDGAVYVYFGSATGVGETADQTLTSAGGFGYALDSAGDVNGDGFGDVVIGAPSMGDAGQAMVYLGSAAGLGSPLTIEGESSGYSFGIGVAGAGDLNADGYDDVLVGAYAGLAYVFYGSASGVNTTGEIVVTGDYTDGFLDTLDGAGDVNADGYDDVVVGFPGRGTGAEVQVFAGGATGLGSTPMVTLTDASVDSFGDGVWGAGDLDGDGIDDILVRAADCIGNADCVSLYPGSASGPSSAAFTLETGGTDDDGFGQAVGAADFNNDGYMDLAISDDQGGVFVYRGYGAGVFLNILLHGDDADAFGDALVAGGDFDADGDADLVVGAVAFAGEAGRAYVYDDILGTQTPYTITGESESLGWSVSGAGDVNGDGFEDVLVGSPGWSANTGKAYLYAGSASGLATSATSTLTGVGEETYFGAAVAGAGDVNGDGFADVVVGAYTGSDDLGHAYLFVGSATGLSEPAWDDLDGAFPFAYAVAGGGDINGDGYDDVLIGAGGNGYGAVPQGLVYLGGATALTLDGTYDIGADSQATVAVAGAADINADGYADAAFGAGGLVAGDVPGTAVVYFGSSSGLTGPTALVNTEGRDAFGAALSAGDLNGDGYGDVIVGAPGDDVVYVHAGSPSGVDAMATGSVSGSSLSARSAGDLNNDGYDDVIVGGDGEAYLYAGSATGLETTPVTTLTGDADFGASVAGAGDVNGDGYDDVVIGAPEANDHGGQALLYLGYATDADADLVDVAFDCDDADASIGAPSTRYADADGDGFGDPASPSSVCPSDPGYVDDATDCDDTNATINANTLWYADSDGDSFGDGTVTVTSCEVPAGYVSDTTDCDDTLATVNPGADELCDEIDNNCDGLADDATAADPTTWHVDADGDGYGDAAFPLTQCDRPEGYVSGDTDCDDTNPDAYPGATEMCDFVDNNCDGLVDDPTSADAQTFYHDFDLDTFGDANNTTQACSLPDGYVTDNTDCAPYDASIGGPTVRYRDYDRDTYGDVLYSDVLCPYVVDHVADSSDCNDYDADVHPGATETPDDGVDSDCDGEGEDTAGDTDTDTDADDTSPTDAEDTGETGADKGCSCATEDPGAAWGVLVPLVALARRRASRR